MPDPRHERLRRLFDRALELPALERKAFLDRECADDAALKQRIVAMLAASQDERFLSAPTGVDSADSIVDLATLAPVREGPGSHIGPY